MLIPCQYCPKACQSNAAMSSHVRHKHPLAKFNSVLKESLKETYKQKDDDDDIIVVDTEYSREDLNEATAISNAGQKRRGKKKRNRKLITCPFHSATGGPHSINTPHSNASKSV